MKIRFLTLTSGLLLAGLTSPTRVSGETVPAPPAPVTPENGVRPAGPLKTETQVTVEGWKVNIHPALWEKERDATAAALRLLHAQLAEIVRVVPAPAVAKLREVPLWFSPQYQGTNGGAEYHPDEGWLRGNGRDPAMAKGVEFSNISRFAQEMERMPNFALHELAHAFHDRVLTFTQPEILSAFASAKAAGTYDRVARHHGNGRPGTVEKAYAMADAKEYFAEGTEAFFSRNDYFPFTRAELEAHDPVLAALLGRLWGGSY